MAKKPKKKSAKNSSAIETPEALVDDYQGGWKSALLAAISVVFLAALYWQFNIFEYGYSVFDLKLITGKLDAVLMALCVVASVFFVAEHMLVCPHSTSNKSVKESIESIDIKHLALSFKIFLEYWVLFFALSWFYKVSPEYGFLRKTEFYQPWFYVYEYFRDIYLFIGFPYIVITLASKSKLQGEQVGIGNIYKFVFMKIVSILPPFREKSISLEESEKQKLLNILIKAFFSPIMVVIFYDQFQKLVKNINVIFGDFNLFTTENIHFEMANIFINFVLCIHAGLAICSYLITSRWLGNHIITVDRKFSGWFICLLAFPPFSHSAVERYIEIPISEYFYAPSLILGQIESQAVVYLFILLAMVMYFIFLCSTINLGLRYANLSNKGIVKTGLYKYIRHPAYSSKMTGTFLLLLPLTALNMHDGNWSVAFSLCFAYLVLVFICCFRALAEERHLLQDESYVKYCSMVRYRFIPNLI